MEIRQVLKSSASMYPNLFYKVSDETRRMERGGETRREERRGEEDEREKERSEEASGNHPQVDVAKSGKITEDNVRGGRTKIQGRRSKQRESKKKKKEGREVKGGGRRGEGGREVQKKETAVKPLAAGAWLRSGTCASLAISKPRLIRQALNSSAPRVPEWSWGSCVGGAGPGEASEGGATGHAATHTAVSVTVRRGWAGGGGRQGGRRKRRRGEVVLVGGEGCNHARRERGGGGGGGGACMRQRTEDTHTQCTLIRIWRVTTRWQQCCHAGREHSEALMCSGAGRLLGPVPAGLAVSLMAHVPNIHNTTKHI